jgi:cytochrome c553
MMHRSRFALILLLPLALVVSSCGRADDGAQTQGGDRAATVEDMHRHVEQVRLVEEAVIRGDIEGAQEPARWIAEHKESPGLPADTGQFLDDMRTAARRVAGATDVETAAQGAASLVASCGNCHAASNVTANLPEVTIPAAATDRAGHMREHQAAVELLYRGLAAPSDENWRKGAEMLRGSPLAHGDMGDIAKEVQAAEGRVHEIAERAVKAGDRDTRVQVYGELVSTCASCHGMHGKVWGPGVPRTE